jgi:hypothetical protein
MRSIVAILAATALLATCSTGSQLPRHHHRQGRARPPVPPPEPSPAIRCLLHLAIHICPREQLCVATISADGPTTISYNSTTTPTGYGSSSPLPPSETGICIGSSCGGLTPRPPVCPIDQTCLSFEDVDRHLPGKCVVASGKCRVGSENECEEGWVCAGDKAVGCLEGDGEEGEVCWGLCMPERWVGCFEEGRWPGCH